MCGIAVIAGPRAASHRPALRRMLRQLTHRGPDGEGESASPACLLGHRRLSIIDREGGAQPLQNPACGLSVVCNGEIYNFRELRRRLSFPYQTRSDSEVLLAAYAAYGLDLCGHLRGMFAFALWDERQQRLICGRDRFGEKPLYYAFAPDGSLLVASEVKALLASGLLQPHLDRQALAAYLQLRFVPEGRSMVEGIRQLPPGWCMVWEEGRLRMFRYWEPPAGTACISSEDEAAEELRRLLERAVSRCLVADVEVGLLLSGGQDSTSIAALMARMQKGQAFALGVGGAKDELAYARAAARCYGFSLHEVACAELDVPSLLLEMPGIYDEPLADTSCLPTLLLCRYVSSHVKVALAGDGGDELLGGYAWYAGLGERAASQPCPGQGWTRFALAHMRGRMVCDAGEIRAAGLEPYAFSLPAGLDDTLADALRLDAMYFLPADVLKKTDRAAMSCGLELRAPFLDRELAEFSFKLPWNMKHDGVQGKKLLQRAFAEIWPEEVRRRPKQGFGLKTGELLRRQDVEAFMQDMLFDRRLRIWKLFPDAWLQRHLQARKAMMWNLLMLSLWLEHYKIA